MDMANDFMNFQSKAKIGDSERILDFGSIFFFAYLNNFREITGMYAFISMK